MVTHLSQLLTYITGFGDLIVPLIVGLTQRDKVLAMEHQDQQIVNFQSSLIVYCILYIPLILVFTDSDLAI